MNSTFKLLLSFLAVLAISGCTRSITANYVEGIELESNSLGGANIAVYPFSDERPIVDAKDQNSKTYVSMAGPWRFGLTYGGSDFKPIAEVVQDVFIREFNQLGMNAYKGSESGAKGYSLTGRIVNFEFENEIGLVTVTSRRHVSLVLTLADENGKEVFSNESFNDLDRENEGMAIMHSTNVAKLMDGALKKVVVSVVRRLNGVLASEGVEKVSVILNGRDISSDVYALAVAQN